MSTDSAPRKRRVLLVDDHPIVRHGLSLLIDQEDDLMVCGETSSAVETLDNFKMMEPDIAIVDLSLQDSSGLELTAALKETQPGLPILVLSMHDESLYAERVLRAGARGYVMKQESAETVLKAVRKVLSGGVYLSECLSSRILREFVDGTEAQVEKFGIETLSNRELEVFELIGRGHSTRDIANRLSLSIKTIEAHRARVKQKLKIGTAAELVHRALHWVETGGSKR